MNRRFQRALWAFGAALIISLICAFIVFLISLHIACGNLGGVMVKPVIGIPTCIATPGEILLGSASTALGVTAVITAAAAAVNPTGN